MPVNPVAVDVPVNEKGDEPLQNHQEEIEESHDVSDEEGLTILQKIGALAVIVIVCAVFVRSTAGARGSSTSDAYEKVAT